MPTPVRFFSLALACAALAASPAWATSAGDAAVTIVYGYKAEGLYKSNWALDDLNALFDTPPGGVGADAFQTDGGALRHGPWHLWRPAGPLSVAEARAAFAGAGVTLDGPARTVPVAWTDAMQVFESPGGAPWLAPWLVGKDPVHLHPRLRTGALFKARGATGQALMIYAERGDAPPAAMLKQGDAWQWETMVHGQAHDAKGAATTYHAIPRTFGGIALHALAARWRAQADALRVDVGNLVDDASAAEAALGLPDTLDAVGKMGVDALVPFDFELRLPHDAQVKLAATVPLVAANMKGPDDVPVKPFVIAERRGRKIAVIGLVDAEHVKRYSLYAADHGWTTEDPFQALPRVLKEVKALRPDAIVIATNLVESELPRLRDAATGVSALITRFQTRGDWSYKERFEASPKGERGQVLPWISVGGSKDQVGRLTLGFDPGGLRWVENEVARAIGDQESDPEPARTWAYMDRLRAHQAQRQEPVLPDRRRLAELDARLARPDGRPATQYDRKAYSALIAGALREAASAEIALVHVVRNAASQNGDVPNFVARQWLGQERVMLAKMSGAQLKQVLARDGGRSPFATAGYDPAQGLVAGRPLEDTEVYKVVTTESIARSATAEDDFDGEPDGDLRLEGAHLVRGGDGVGIADVTLAVMGQIHAHAGGFNEKFLKRQAALMLDDGATPESRWSVLVRNNEFSLQQFRVSGREAFDKVRNADINNPDSTILGAKVDLALLNEGDWLDWENRARLNYERADVVEPEPDPNTPADAAEQDDTIWLTTEFQLKRMGIPVYGLPESPLVPYVSGNFLTEFTPGLNDDGGLNPRRQEANAHAGLLFRPGGIFKELRLGGVAKNDLAATVGRFEPGAQAIAVLEQPVGPATLAVQADLRRYFETSEDGPEDLAWLNKGSAALRFPLGSAFSLSVGVEGLLFRGKIVETATWGTTLSPIFGITYNAVWKPRFGVLFDPGEIADEDEDKK